MKSHHWLNATIVLDTGLHIGGEKNNLPADSLLRRDSSGAFVLTGRALGGCLRSIADRLAPRLGYKPCRHLESSGRSSQPCGCPVCQLFGERYPNENSNSGTASKLWFFDAVLPVDQEQTHIRDGVGIEDTSGAAARNIKFDYEVLPAGTRLPFHVEWKEDLTESDTILLAAALGEWANHRGQLGGRSARGLGAFHLEDLHNAELNLDTVDALMQYLSNQGQPEQLNVKDDWYQRGLSAAVEKLKKDGPKEPDSVPEAAAGGFVEIKFDLVYQGQALTNDPLVAALSGYDHAPLVECLWPGEGEVERPVLSGSSLRGALRFRAARIARTLGNCPVCDPLSRSSNLPNASCETRVGGQTLREVPEDQLCLGCQLFGSQMRGSRLWVRDAHYGSASAKGGWMAQDFLAIDRFTGGGQDGAKFDAAGLTQPCFHAALVLHSPRSWELGWLALLLRDLVEGELVIGFGGAKGYSLTQAQAVQWKLGFLQPWDIPGSPYESGEPSGVYQVVTRDVPEGAYLPDELRMTAEGWLKAFTEKVEQNNTHTESAVEGSQS